MIEDIFLGREEIPLMLDNENKVLDFYIPLPVKVIDYYKNKDTTSYAVSAIKNSLNKTIAKAIDYEFERRIDIDTTAMKSINSKSFDEIKSDLLEKYKLIDENNDVMPGKYPEAIDICKLVMSASDFRLKISEKMKEKYSVYAKKEVQYTEKYISLLCSGTNGLFNFGIPGGNGVSLIIENQSSFNERLFNIAPEKLENFIIRNKRVTYDAYVPYNVDTLYQAIIFREFAINYIELLVKNPESL